MSSGRTDRIILGACIPPVLGSLIFYVFMFITNPSYSPVYIESPIIDSLTGVLYVTTISFIVFGIQSLLYSLLMEFAVQKINNDFLVFFISMVLGALIAKFMGIHVQIIGGITGLIVGFFLRRHIKLKPANKKIQRDYIR